MFPAVDTKNASAVAAEVLQLQRELFPTEPAARLDRVFTDVVAMFEGTYQDFARNDLPYHDLEHTLGVALCLARMLVGRARLIAAPALTAKDFQLAIAAALLHDTGYLRTRSDTAGTGAKYTYAHVLRGCAIAASYLPARGFSLREIEGVLGAIRCTGPTSEIGRLSFESDLQRTVCCCLVTADYLAQMAAPAYPDKLAALYTEFTESDDYLRIPPERRAFGSARDLMVRTPAFWQQVVRPRLEADYDAVYRFLAPPDATAANPYINDVERNIALIATRIAALSPSVA